MGMSQANEMSPEQREFFRRIFSPTKAEVAAELAERKRRDDEQERLLRLSMENEHSDAVWVRVLRRWGAKR